MCSFLIHHILVNIIIIIIIIIIIATIITIITITTTTATTATIISIIIIIIIKSLPLLLLGKSFFLQKNLIYNNFAFLKPTYKK